MWWGMPEEGGLWRSGVRKNTVAATKQRTQPGDLVDQIILLCALERARKRRIPLGRTVLTKIMFKAELELSGESPAPSWAFYKWRHGPFSKELYQDLGILNRVGLLRETKLSRRGAELAQYLREQLSDLAAWRDSLRAVDAAGESLWGLGAGGVRVWSHSLRVIPCGEHEPVRIHDIPNATDLLCPRGEGWRPLRIPQDVLEVFLCARLTTDDDIALMHQPARETLAQLHG
jgi:hypothetical protein